MDESARHEIREYIQNEIARCESDIERLKELTRPIPPDNAIGRLSRMEAIQEKNVHEATLRSTRDRCSRLKQALARVDDEEFGLCARCGEEIPVKRLLVVPESRRCVACAS